MLDELKKFQAYQSSIPFLIFTEITNSYKVAELNFLNKENVWNFCEKI